MYGRVEMLINDIFNWGFITLIISVMIHKTGFCLE